MRSTKQKLIEKVPKQIFFFFFQSLIVLTHNFLLNRVGSEHMKQQNKLKGK